MSEEFYEGSCLCGRVHVSVKREGAIPAVCNCRHCQKQTGSAFSTVLLAPLGNIVVTGALSEYADVNDAGDAVVRMFCPNCGSPVQTRSVNDEAAGMGVVKAGLLDGGAPAPVVEVFRRSAFPWVPDLPSKRRFEAAFVADPAGAG